MMDAVTGDAVFAFAILNAH